MRALDCIDRNFSAAERTDFRGRGSGLFDFFVDELRFCRRHELYDEENCERDYQKIEDSLNEVAIVERGVSCLGSERGSRVLRGVKSRAVAENDEHILEAAGLTMSDIVKTTVFLQDMSLFAGMNGVYATYFEGAFPARSAVAVKALPKDALVEIECIAAR